MNAVECVCVCVCVCVCAHAQSNVLVASKIQPNQDLCLDGLVSSNGHLLLS